MRASMFDWTDDVAVQIKFSSLQRTFSPSRLLGADFTQPTVKSRLKPAVYRSSCLFRNPMRSVTVAKAQPHTQTIDSG
ncbi:hypothetical protein ACTXT7_016780 [Hymenolepis weldensis]